jgi:hypothetical protein
MKPRPPHVDGDKISYEQAQSMGPEALAALRKSLADRGLRLIDDGTQHVVKNDLRD